MKIESWISPTVISVLYTVLIFVLLCAAVAWTMLTGSDTNIVITGYYSLSLFKLNRPLCCL